MGYNICDSLLFLDEFKEAVRQANETKQLHILVEDIEKSKVVIV